MGPVMTGTLVVRDRNAIGVYTGEIKSFSNELQVEHDDEQEGFAAAKLTGTTKLTIEVPAGHFTWLTDPVKP